MFSRCAPNLDNLEVKRDCAGIADCWASVFHLIHEFKYLKTLSFFGLKSPSEDIEEIEVKGSVCSKLDFLKLDYSYFSVEVMKAFLLKCPHLNKLETHHSYKSDEDVLATIVEYGSSLTSLIIVEDPVIEGLKLLGSDKLVELGGLKSLVELTIPSSCKLPRKILIRELPSLNRFNNIFFCRICINRLKPPV